MKHVLLYSYVCACVRSFHTGEPCILMKIEDRLKAETGKKKKQNDIHTVRSFAFLDMSGKMQRGLRPPLPEHHDGPTLKSATFSINPGPTVASQ